MVHMVPTDGKAASIGQGGHSEEPAHRIASGDVLPSLYSPNLSTSSTVRPARARYTGNDQP